MLRRIKMEYNLTDISWIAENSIFQSEKGKKRIRIWKDKQLLQWHIKWRDQLSIQSGILLDRMIRTKSGEPFFISDKGWVSIHDEIEERYPTKGKEEEWGKLIGHTLANGINTSDDCQRFKKQEPLSLKTVMVRIEQLPIIDPIAKHVLERSYFEAKKRSQKAHQLKDHIQQKKNPILPAVLSIENARQVFSHLFWISGKEQPERGYKPIRNFLEKWYEKNGEPSTVQLLDCINNYFCLKEDNGILLLSECLIPYEIEQIVSRLSLCKTDDEINEEMDRYFKSWETTRKLVLLLSNWIEKDRERVMA